MKLVDTSYGIGWILGPVDTFSRTSHVVDCSIWSIIYDEVKTNIDVKTYKNVLPRLRQRL